jgi:hypothetical protein
MLSFFDDIEELCEKYNFSIAHEDCHGGFLIEEYSQNNMEWLRNASKNYEEEPEEPPTSLFCEECGITETSPYYGQRYCRYCGAKFKENKR